MCYIAKHIICTLIECFELSYNVSIFLRCCQGKGNAVSMAHISVLILDAIVWVLSERLMLINSSYTFVQGGNLKN